MNSSLWEKLYPQPWSSLYPSAIKIILIGSTSVLDQMQFQTNATQPWEWQQHGDSMKMPQIKLNLSKMEMSVGMKTMLNIYLLLAMLNGYITESDKIERSQKKCCKRDSRSWSCFQEDMHAAYDSLIFCLQQIGWLLKSEPRQISLGPCLTTGSCNRRFVRPLPVIF